MNIKDLRLKRHVPKLTERRIRQIEEELGCPLPDDYRAFLRSHNGGDCVPGHFHTTHNRRRYGHHIVTFLHIDKNGARPNEDALLHSLSRVKHTYEVAYQVLPKGWLPIGRDDTDNFVLLRLTGRSAGRIGFLYVGEEFPSPEQDNPVHKVAKSFDEFIALLSPTEDDDVE